MSRFLACLCILLHTSVFSQERIDSMLTIVNQNKYDSTHAKTLLNLGIEFERMDSKLSKSYYQKCIKISEDHVQGRWLGTACVRLAVIYSNTGTLDSSDYYFSKAREYLDANKADQKFKSSFYSSYGLYNFNLGNYTEALDAYATVGNIDKAALGTDNMAGNYLNISNVYKKIGDVNKTIESVFKALELFESIPHEMGISFCHNSLGNIFYDQKDYDKAILYFDKSLEGRKKRGDKRGTATVQNNIANVYMDTGRLNEALALLQDALKINESLNLPTEVAMNYVNMGKIFQKQNNTHEALRNFEEAKRILTQAGLKTHMAFILAEIGRLYTEQGQFDKASINLLLGVEQAKESQDLKSELNAYTFLKELYLKQGKHKEAYTALENQMVLTDSLESKNLKMKLNELATKYESEKKETEIALLKAEQELQSAELERQRAFQTLIIIALLSVVIISVVLVNRYRVLNRTRRQLELEKMRSQIAQDLHDDLGSTLSSINIISQMALNNGHAEAKHQFQRIQEQSAKMMDNMSDIVWSINPNNDSLSQVLIKMKEFAAEILEPKNINYSFQEVGDINNTYLNIEKRKNLFLIFKESINNAAKYSEGKHIEIVLSAENEHLNLLIKDDGKGFDPAEITAGNGLKNMEQRAQSIGGKIRRNSFKGQGTSISLEIPIT